MALLDSRSRAGYLLLTAVVGHVLLISAQVNAKTGVPILEAVTFGVFAEGQRGTSAVTNSIRGVWTGYVGLRQVRRENANCSASSRTLRCSCRTAGARGSQPRPRAAARLRDRTALETVAATIVGSGVTPDFRTVTIDKGSLQNLKADMAVIAPAGVVGGWS
jgi:rod shape-determining protein MreC